MQWESSQTITTLILFNFLFRLMTSHFFLRGQKELTKKKATRNVMAYGYLRK